MSKTRLKIAKPDIVNLFNMLSEKVFTRAQIDEVLSLNRKTWRLTESMTTYKFIQFLIDEAALSLVRFEFPSRAIIRYVWGEASVFEIVKSLKPDSFFSHYTAMYLHDLTDQLPKTIYLNSEQPPKPRGDRTLDKNRIKNAFSNRPRISNNIALFNEFKICLLNGMYTKKSGVIEIEEMEGDCIPTTDIERTLIDITVRPFYAGGVFEVLRAYKLAKGRVSINKLAAMLKKLDYVYPYHQAIGFYLEKSGVYKESSIRLMKKFEINYDFYLTYKMKNMSYSKDWRLYFPKDL